MNVSIPLRRVSLVLVCAAALAGCGDKGSENTAPRTKDPMPFVRLKIMNKTPAGGHPATATAVPSQAGVTRSPLTAGPADPQKTKMNNSGTETANTVEVTVTFTGGSTLKGSGSYAIDAFIGGVDVECNETPSASATALVTFADGRPSQTITLAVQ